MKIIGFAGDAVDAAPRQHIREAQVDLQAVRHKRRRLHKPGRAWRADKRGARPHGTQEPRGRGTRAAGSARQGLQEARPQPGRRHHHRGVHGELPQGLLIHLIFSYQIILNF